MTPERKPRELAGLLLFCEFRMTRSLIVFGNGLGMALDPNHFSLTAAMQDIWQGQSLTVDQKENFGKLKGINPQTGPTSEEDLISAQIALELLESFREKLGDDAQSSWFTEPAKSFPITIRTYVYKVASRFMGYQPTGDNKEIWNKFLESFISYIMDSKSHIVTLNYDDLIYDKIVYGIEIYGKWVKPSELLTCGAPTVRDGFISGNYRPESFSWSKETGSYLHLHGTPLFVTQGQDIRKLERASLAESDPKIERHIILANPKSKLQLIRESKILDNFWEVQLPRCLIEADQIIIFGYSGLDDHLNEKIKAMEKPKYIVEWSGARDTTEQANIFWKDKIGCVESVSRADNILEFDCWERPGEFIPF